MENQFKELDVTKKQFEKIQKNENKLRKKVAVANSDCWNEGSQMNKIRRARWMQLGEPDGWN